MLIKVYFNVPHRERGEGDKWERVIYPGMVEAIKHVLLVSQDFIDDRKVHGERGGAGGAEYT